MYLFNIRMFPLGNAVYKCTMISCILLWSIQCVTVCFSFLFKIRAPTYLIDVQITYPQTSSASCLVVTDEHIFCGCADGVIRVFRPANLQYITTLPRPHRLGVDLAKSGQNGYARCKRNDLFLRKHCLHSYICNCACFHSSLSPASPGAQYPDMLALTFDPASKHLTCVYNDHSVYVWDVKDVRNVGKLYSALYHSSSVWSVEVRGLQKYFQKLHRFPETSTAFNINVCRFTCGLFVCVSFFFFFC